MSASTTSTPSTPWASRCCAGRSTRARSRRALGGAARRRWAPRWCAVGERADSDFVGLGLTENEGYTRVDARARVRLVRGLEAFVVAREPFDSEYQEALGYPGPGPDGARGPALRGTGAALSRDGPARLEQRQGQRVDASTSCAARADVEVVGLLTTVNAAHDRVAMHAVRRALLEAQARGGRPSAARRSASRRPAPTRATRRPWREALGARARGRRRGRGLRRPLPGGRPPLPRAADGGHRARACSSRSGAGRRRRWRARCSRAACAPASPASTRACCPRRSPAARSTARCCADAARRASTPAARTASSTPSPGTGRCSRARSPCAAGEVVERDGFVFADLLPDDGAGGARRREARTRSPSPAWPRSCLGWRPRAPPTTPRARRVAEPRRRRGAGRDPAARAAGGGDRASPTSRAPRTSSGRVPPRRLALPEGRHGAAGGARARTWWSSRSTPTPTSCGCSSAPACACTACRASSSLRRHPPGHPRPGPARWASEPSARSGWSRATTRTLARAGAAPAGRAAAARALLGRAA